MSSPITTDEWVEGPTGMSFFTKTVEPAVPVVGQIVFVHGFIEHVQRYTYVFEQFAAQGLRVSSFDQRGFGATGAKAKALGATSWDQALKDITFFIDRAHAKDATVPLFLVGHSMGGALTLAYATRTPPTASISKLAGIVSAAPLILQAKAVRSPTLIVKIGSILGAISPKMQMKTVVTPADICRDTVVQDVYAKDPLCAPVGTFKGLGDMLLGGAALLSSDYARFPANLPLLVTHGDGDKVTEHDASKLFVEKLVKDGKDARFISYPGYYHELHNEPGDLKDKPINDWISFIKSKL